MSTIYISEAAHPLLRDFLINEGHTIETVKSAGITYEPVDSHPDIYMCSLGINKPVFFGCPEKIGRRYPENIRYNAACTGRFFIHNLKYTDPDLMAAAENTVKINVSQGYTKCNVLIVDDNSIITSDEGIYKSCYGKLDVLLIKPGHIRLKNFTYGFIGGASGRIGRKIIFNGNLEMHPDHEKIAAFIESRDLELVYFSSYELEDIGSIIELPR